MSAPLQIIHGGGEMGKLVRAKDWSESALGPLDSWPTSLRTTINLSLASNFPISIAWGPHRVQIYNDGYWPICGAKHPRAMGQDFKECWLSAWPAIGEAFEQASAGQTAFLENQRMFLDRNGYLEETFFTFSFSPIRDETGKVGGLFHPVTELTQQTLAERRLEVLRDVADRTTDAASVQEALWLLGQTLGRHELDLPFVLIYRVDGDAHHAQLVQSHGLPVGTQASPTLVDLQSSEGGGWPLTEVVRLGQPARFVDTAERLAPFCCGPYPEQPPSALILPIHVLGQVHPLAAIVAGVSARRPLDGPYRAFFELLATTIASALSKARAYEMERQRAEALQELDKAKTTFFSNVSHEFRTPLTLLLGPLEEELRENPGSRSRLELAHRNSLRLLKLVNSLLDFARIEAGRVKASYEPVDLAAMTTDLAAVFRAAIEKAGLKLVVDCPPLPEPVYVDREMWEKIVLNLLSNALKFTFEGQISVALRRTGERAELSVSDTGVGVPSMELPRLFERFHRVQGARARSHEGTGIGLALVQELAKLHGGEVKVQSVEGTGTTFTVTLPLGTSHLPADHVSPSRHALSTATGAAPFVEEALRWLPDELGVEASPSTAAQLPEASATTPQRGDSRERAQVLLADDNADMRHYLKRLLCQQYDVIAVPDGQAALEAARQQHVDLVLTDVMMPRLDGFALLAALRADPERKTLPVILLSARAGEESKIEGLGAGADDYLVKPFSARELLSRVSSALMVARIRREAEAAVRSSEVRYRRLFEAASDGVLLLDTRTHKITDANPFMTELLGYSREELVGKELFEIGLLKDTEASQAAYATLERNRYVRYEDLPLRHKSGDVREVEFISNVYEEDGHSVIQCNVRDITDRKHAEALQAHFHAFFESAPAPYLVLNPEYQIVAASDAYLQATRTTREAIMGRGVFEVFPDPPDEPWADGARNARASFDRVKRNRRTDVLPIQRYPIRRPESEGGGFEERWWSPINSPVLDPSGELAFIIHRIEDVTSFISRLAVERRAMNLQSMDASAQHMAADIAVRGQELARLNEQLRHTQRQLEDSNQELMEFATVVSHDLKAPLRAVAALASWTQSDYADRLDDEGRQNLAEMVKRVARMDQMINGVLEYSRVGREQGHPESIPLAEVVESVVQDLAPPDNIHVTVAPGLPVVQGLSVRLRQVFQNLLSNAIKYRDKPHTEISVEWADRETEWEFLVADNGPGIEERHFERIFGMFQTLAPKDRTDSTGVGLALVKRIVERQPGGRVWVTSRPGQGTTIHFTWPKAPPAATHGQAREPRALERTGEGTSEADHGRP